MVKRSERGGAWSLHGYFCDITWDGTTLRVHGRNKAAREFFNEADPQADLLVAAADIRAVDFRPASFTRNGVLTVLTQAGHRHLIYALRQHNSNFSRLADELRAAIPADASAAASASGAAVAGPSTHSEAGQTGTSGDPIELLARLAKLRDSGVLTTAEFEAKKAELLRRI